MSAKAPTTWKRSSGFIWAMLGSAIGFANILSFSSQCYKNGGGAFLIPFMVAILVLGLPMLILEGTVGHKLRLPIVSAFGLSGGSLGKFFGWLCVVAVATIGTFYLVLTGYSIAYTYYSGASLIPADTATFFKSTFLHDSGSLARLGVVSIPAVISLLLVGIFSWIVLARNIRSGVEKICSIFLPLLCILIFAFALIVCFLPGAWTGFGYYLFPDFSKLSDPHLWRDVFGQVFFSISLGLGIVTGYARHTKESTSIPRAMFYVAVGDAIVSVVAGFAIFGCVGYLSHMTGVPFTEIVQSDSTFEMGFVIFPKILQVLGPVISPIVGVLFFICVFIAGVTGVFSIMESVMGNLQIEFSIKRKTAAAIAALLFMGGGFCFCFGNSQCLMGALAPMVLGNNFLIGGLAEIAFFMYLSHTIRTDEVWHSNRGSYVLLRLVIPVILVVILASSIFSELQSGVLNLDGAVRWGWFLAAGLLAFGLSRKGTPEASLAALSS